MDSNQKIIEYYRIEYETEPYYHRIKICDVLDKMVDSYDYIIFEQVNLFRGKFISKLSNIMSLAFLQAKIIDRYSERIGICEVNVRSWKVKVLGNGNAKKEDSVAYVKSHYPDVDLEIKIPYKKKKGKFKTVVDDDTADAVCISKYGVMSGKTWLEENRVNFT